MIPSRSLLNEDWYARLKRGVTEAAQERIRATGSEADDPFWRAREGEGMGDLARAREDERRQRFEGAGVRAGIAGMEMRAKEGARQRTISAALARDPQQRSTYMGVQADGPVYAGYGLTTETLGAGIGAGVPAQPELGFGVPPSRVPPDYMRPQRGAGPWRPYVSPPVSFGAPKPPSSLAAPAFNPAQFASQDIAARQKGLDDMIYKIAESLYKRRPRAVGQIGQWEGSPMDYYAEAAKLIGR